MAVRFVAAYGEDGVEEEDALLRPAEEVAVGRSCGGEGWEEVGVGGEFFVDVAEGGGDCLVFVDGECKSCGVGVCACVDMA